jgi:hypothetical protein
MLIGAVAAIMSGISDPGTVFAAATRFMLPPAGWWSQC